jgi:putative PIN family toxin of toxin-antitoxin system
MRIVVDTNIIASAIFFDGLPEKLTDLILTDSISVIATESIVKEYEKTILYLLNNPKTPKPQMELAALITHLTFIEPHTQIEICRDPDDDKFISCAKDGLCSHIVSGDKDLLVLGQYENTKISPVRDFLEFYKTTTRPINTSSFKTM